MRKALCAVLFLACCPFFSAQQVPFLIAQQTPYLSAQQALSNDSIIKMAGAQLSDDVIVTTVNASPGAYDTSPDGLIALKQAGVSDKVIAAIAAKGTGAAPDPAAASTPDASAPASPLPPSVENIGAYYKDGGGNWPPLPSEVVVFESGGLIKHFASAGLMKQDLNGLVGGMRSRLVVSAPVTFILHVPQGRTASDYGSSPSYRRQQPAVSIRCRRPDSRIFQLASRRDRFLEQADRPLRLSDCPRSGDWRGQLRFSCAAGHGLAKNTCQFRQIFTFAIVN